MALLCLPDRAQGTQHQLPPPHSGSKRPPGACGYFPAGAHPVLLTLLASPPFPAQVVALGGICFGHIQLLPSLVVGSGLQGAGLWHHCGGQQLATMLPAGMGFPDVHPTRPGIHSLTGHTGVGFFSASHLGSAIPGSMRTPRFCGGRRLASVPLMPNHPMPSLHAGVSILFALCCPWNVFRTVPLSILLQVCRQMSTVPASSSVDSFISQKITFSLLFSQTSLFPYVCPFFHPFALLF